MPDIATCQTIQRVYDNDFFELASDPFEQVRHICLHLACTLGKLSRYCEQKEHTIFDRTEINQQNLEQTIINDVIPDLFIHSLQLANVYDLNLSNLFAARTSTNIERFKQIT